MSLFALRTLFADRGKLLTALVGVVFALVLVNVQGGLFLGMIQKASLLTDNCAADIWVARRGVENVDLPANLPTSWIERIRGLPGVSRAEPYVLGSAALFRSDGEYEPIWLIGVDSNTMLGGPWSFHEGSLDDLRRPDAIAVDHLDEQKLGPVKVGEVVEINERRARVTAKTRGTQNFITTPIVFATTANARRFLGLSENVCSYFLVEATDGADLGALSEEIRQVLPDADVHTSPEFSQLSRDYWMKRTGIGISFGGATLLGVTVGFLMVAQSLYTLALDHLSEYATLKAMGAEDRQVLDVVVLQSLSIATMGSSVGVGLVLLIQRVASTPLAPIEIPPLLLGGGVVLVFGICLISVILPWLRIRGVDPATVLQG